MTPPSRPALPDALLLLDYVGIAVFAVSGALLAAEKKQTLVTFIFFAVVTGVGGGTMRDLLIGAPVFWVHTNATLLICIAAAVAVWLFSRHAFAGKALLWFDAIGLAAYATYGAAKALTFGVAPVPAFAMGVMTACVGGIIRDVLAGEPSILMRPELYVTAAALASGLYVGLTLAGAPPGSPRWSRGWPASRCAARRSRAGSACPPTIAKGGCRSHDGQPSQRSIVRHHDAMTDDFYRIRRLPPYVFAEVNAMKAAARARGEDIVDLGMGNPDGAPPPHVIAKLAEVAAKPTAHRYSASKGIPGLRKAQAAYYQRRFDVALDPDSEVIVTLGSKEGLANLAQAITAPGDVVLTPNPSYPIHHFGFIIAGASIRSIPAVPGPDFFDRLEKAMRYTVPRPKVLVIGYPSNPTARDGRPRLLRAARRLRARGRAVDHFRPRLCRNLLRRHAHPVDPAGRGREGRRGRVHLACRRPIRWPAGGSASRSAIRR